MKLYAGPLSLFSRKVEIALHEKAIPFDRVMVTFSQTEGYNPKHPDVLAANPKGQVPVLVDGGVTLFDSTVILEYLEDAYPEPPLYPSSPAERARCRLLDLYADEIMLVPLRCLMHRTEPRTADPVRWDAAESRTQEAEAVLASQFAELDGKLREKDYLCAAFSVADIAVFMMVFYSQRLGGPPLAPYPALQGWHERLLDRKAFALITSEIAAADRELSAPVENAYGGRGYER
jgi:glutathione S-transferase